MTSVFDRVGAGLRRAAAASRRRSRMVDHAWRAWVRYDEGYAGRLAAAGAYYGFFAVFALVVIGFIVLGQVFQDNKTVVDAVTDYLRTNLPALEVKEIIDSSGKISIFAVAGLVVAGVAWVENLRSSQRALWHLDQQPGNPVVRWLVDLGVLIGLGLLLLISVAVFSGLQDLLLRLAGEAEGSTVRVVLRGMKPVVASLVDLLLGGALLAGVPRLRMSFGRLLPSALLFTVGFWLLKTLGKVYVVHTEHNPAYQVVGGTVGLLLFMYLLHQLLLFSAALAATSHRGRVGDLAGGRPPREITAATAAAERAAGYLAQTAAVAERAAAAAAMARSAATGAAQAATGASPAGADVAERARGPAALEGETPG